MVTHHYVSRSLGIMETSTLAGQMDLLREKHLKFAITSSPASGTDLMEEAVLGTRVVLK